MAKDVVKALPSDDRRWYSRCIVGWDIDDTLDTNMVINACEKSI